ncbi:MAG: hypothetical protein HOB92_08800, partial [Candidatus Cloacimonetes bacterium]|nr:hypothetical protein [Candidatus Cloacimonadota bacterium]
MNEEISRQTIIDNEHINLLSMFHLISGILALLYSVFMALYFGFIIFVFKLSENFDGEFPIQSMGVIISIW